MILDVLFLLSAALYNATGYLFVVLGVYILIRVTGFPDLTVDGSFTIGAAVYATLLALGAPFLLGLAAAATCGAIAGVGTWAINSRLGVGKVVSGVLMMILLTLAAPYLTGGSTQSLLRASNLYSALEAFDRDITESLVAAASFQLHLATTSLWFAAFAAILCLCWIFLANRTGLQLRYLGSATNPTLLTSRQRTALTCLGLMIGNAIVAIGGAIEAQRRGGFTVNMGVGVILIGITILVLGESIVKTSTRRQFLRLRECFVALVVGCLVYALGVQLLLISGFAVVDLRLLTVLFLLLLLGIAGRFVSSSTKLF